jgi:hypothetical protein
VSSRGCAYAVTCTDFGHHSFNDITYVRPKVPTLYTALTTGDYASNATVYGRDTNSYVLQKNDIIEGRAPDHALSSFPT